MVKKFKQLTLSLLTGTLLFTYVSELPPVVVEAHEQDEFEAGRLEQMFDTIVQDENNEYIVDLVKVKQYQLQDKLDALHRLVSEANNQRAQADKDGLEQFWLFGLTLAEVGKALVLAGIGWLAKKMFDLGLYISCQWHGYSMYRYSIAGRYNPGSYLFFSLCRSSRLL